MTGPLLECRDLDKAYGPRRALVGVSLVVRDGEHTAVLGRTGTGKSTLLRLVAGLEVPDAGQVLIRGALASMAARVVVAPHARGLSMVFQDLGLWPSLTAEANVRLGTHALRVAGAEQRRLACESLTACGVAHLSSRRPAQMSGGEQQRVALARALASSPHVLLLDEPFGSLDLVTKLALFEEIRRLAADRAMTLLLVTHDPLEAEALCPRFVVLEDGRVVEDGDRRALLSSPKSALLRAWACARGALPASVEEPPCA